MRTPSETCLIIPFKPTERVTFSPALKQYILSTYNEDPERYIKDLTTLDNLRVAVMVPEAHEECVQAHLRYFAQLQYLDAKFNISEGNIQIPFSWGNALSKDSSFSTLTVHSTSFNLGFEKASVLFNLAAVYNRIAGQQDTSTEDGLKKAAAFFQQASGAFNTVSESLSSWGLGGSASFQLNSLREVMLAYAQELFFAKAVAGNMKAGTVAKLAQQVAIFYGAALEFANQTMVFDKPWINFMKSKQSFFTAYAQYYKATEVYDAGKYGEQISRLQIAQKELKSCLESSNTKYINLSKVIEEFKTLNVIVEKALTQANKDNDVIYMDIIPKVETLTPIAAAAMAKFTPIPDLTNSANLVGKPLFQELVPFHVHQAASAYLAKKQGLIKDLTDQLTEATAVAHSTLASLNLPGAIEALEQPIGLPNALLARSEEVRKSGGARYVQEAWQTVLAMAKKNDGLLQQALDRLNEEEKEDTDIKTQFGPRWTRTPSSTLTRNLRETATQYRAKLKAAEDANTLVRKKIDSNMHLLEALSMTKEELEATIPASTSNSVLALKDPNLKQLKSLLETLNRELAQRPDLIKKWKATADADDIGPRLLQNAAKKDSAEEKEVMNTQLKTYDPFKEAVTRSLKEQEASLEAIVAVNTKFMESRQTNDLIRQREGALQNLEEGYKAFKVICGHVQEGIKFYNDFEEILTRFYNNCNDFVVARQMDKSDLLTKIQEAITKVTISGVNALSSAISPSSQPKSPSSPPKPPQPTAPAGYPAAAPQGAYTYGQPPPPGVWNPNQPLNYGYAPPQYPPYGAPQGAPPPGGYPAPYPPPGPGYNYPQYPPPANQPRPPSS